MDGSALLHDWPSFEKVNAETVFASPAWRLETVCGEAPAVLTKAETSASDLLWVSVTLEDEAHVLGIGDSEAYADLHRLWARRMDLPNELLLALVERECGDLFQVLEKVFRRRFQIKGLADGGPADEGEGFRLTAGGTAYAFALDLSPLLLMELGKLKYLDPGHEAICGLRRPAWVEHATVELLEAECAALAAGDCIVLPEGAEAVWRVTVPDDDLVHVRSEAEGEVTFAQMADDNWPALPEPGRVVLLKGGQPAARGSLATLGLQRVFKVEEVADHV